MNTETRKVSLACARSAMMYTVGKRMQHRFSYLRTKELMLDYVQDHV